ncbi:formylglycine-generating enzyme family protein [Streptomyces olivochromogenes]|uniref:formylglycine-generating enzyme family protein n=1 Tax=Streptomyces olivochromogenes TaxID=1963 RepID=UPI0036A40FA1
MLRTRARTAVFGAVAAAPWWLGGERAHGKAPEGPGSDLEDRAVVPVPHHDALAYCAWVGARLPTEAEWEYAARGRLHRALRDLGRDLGDGPRPVGRPRGLVPAPRLVPQPLPGGRPVEEHPRLLTRHGGFRCAWDVGEG